LAKNELQTEIGMLPIGRKYKENMKDYLAEKRDYITKS